MKVYCVFEEYKSIYPEDYEFKLVQIFDSIKKANAFVEEETTKGRYYEDEENDISLTGIVVGWDVL